MTARSRFTGEPAVSEPSVDRSKGITATIRYQVADGLELRSISGRREVTARQFDNSGGAHRSTFLPNANFSRYSLSELRQRQFSQEFQAVGSLPSLGSKDKPTGIPGLPPSLLNRPSDNCPFHARCPYAMERCRTQQPALRELGVSVTISVRSQARADVLAP